MEILPQITQILAETPSIKSCQKNKKGSAKISTDGHFYLLQNATGNAKEIPVSNPHGGQNTQKMVF